METFLTPIVGECQYFLADTSAIGAMVKMADAERNTVLPDDAALVV